MERFVGRGAGRLAVLLSAAAVGCVFTDPACTEIGCGASVTVVVRNLPPNAEVTLRDGSAVLATVNCSGRSSCQVTASTTPDSVVVSVRAGNITIERNAALQYAEDRPNGRDCPPICLTGRATIHL